VNVQVMLQIMGPELGRLKYVETRIFPGGGDDRLVHEFHVDKASPGDQN
jgi:hypothetical protein